MESIAYLIRSLKSFFNTILSRPKMAKGKYPRVQMSRYRNALGGVVTLIMLILLIMAATGIVSLTNRNKGSTFSSFSPVMKGRLDMSRKHETNQSNMSSRRDALEEDRGKQWTQILSWEPRAVLYHNFLSKKECQHLISLAKPGLQKSLVVNSNNGKSIDSSVRTSNGMFLNRGQDEIVEEIERRIALFSHIPVEHGEGLQILHYEFGQKYESHHDYFNDPFNTKNGGERTATMLMYLSDVEEGGETVFPSAKANFSAVPWWEELSECGKRGLSVKPKMGNAVLFWSTKPDGSVDPRSLHGSCPVIKGDKWSAPKWMRLREYKL